MFGNRAWGVGFTIFLLENLERVEESILWVLSKCEPFKGELGGSDLMEL